MERMGKQDFYGAARCMQEAKVLRALDETSNRSCYRAEAAAAAGLRRHVVWCCGNKIRVPFWLRYRHFDARRRSSATGPGHVREWPAAAPRPAQGEGVLARVACDTQQRPPLTSKRSWCTGVAGGTGVALGPRPPVHGEKAITENTAPSPSGRHSRCTGLCRTRAAGMSPVWPIFFCQSYNFALGS